MLNVRREKKEWGSEMKLWSCICVFTSALLVNAQTIAEPSKPISSMMDTPSTVFDMYLFRLLEQSKCNQGWFGNREKDDKPDLCMTTIEYQYADNLIEMNFFVQERHEKMKGFTSASDIQKEKILKNILIEVAQSVGVVSRGDGKLNFRFGMIQMTPMRHGWGTSSFDEEVARDEISDRTVIHLRSNVDGFVYKATRNHHGKIMFEKKEFSL